MHASVATVLDEIAVEHGREYAAAARQAWGELTDDGGPEDVSQYSLQVFCWAATVRRHEDPADRVRWVQALSELLRRLGLHRYSEIAWGPGTRELLEAARSDADGGRSTYNRLMREAGVLPADTEMLTWGTAHGPVEGGLIRRVADTIELASVTGAVQPGRRTAGRDRRQVTREVLLAPSPGEPGAPVLAKVLAERAELWAGAGRSMARSSLLAPLIDRVAVARPLIDGVDLSERLARLWWLVERCKEPEPLTSAGYLKPATVRDFVGDVGEPHGFGRGNRESQRPDLRYTRQVAQGLSLVRRHAGELRTTKQATSTSSPVELAPLVARRWLDRGPWDVEQHAREAVVATLLTGPSTTDDLVATVMVVLGEMGWRGSDGSPLTAEDTYWFALEPYRELHHVGLLADHGYSGQVSLAPGAAELLLESVRQFLAHRDPRAYALA
jgi:hypothetical protein